MTTKLKKPLKEKKSVSSQAMPKIMAIPDYFQHVTENIIATESGDLMASFIISGMPYQATDDGILYRQFNKVKDYAISLGTQFGNKVSLWTHFIKRKRTLNTRYKSTSTFCNNFYDKYSSTFSGEEFFSNEYRLTISLKTTKDDDMADAIKMMESIISRTESYLQAFDASVLSLIEVETDETLYYRSEIGEFFYYLVNHRDGIVKAGAGTVQQSINTADVHYGYDTAMLKSRGSENESYFTGMTIRDFPLRMEEESFNCLLKTKAEFIVAQSAIFITQGNSLKKTDSQRKKLLSQKFTPDEDQEEIKLANSALSRSEICFVDYHCAVVVFGETAKEARIKGALVENDISTSTGMKLLPATHELSRVFESVMPGYKKRPMSSIRSTSVLACLFSCHNNSEGKQFGNPLGDGTAVMPMKSDSDSIYWFNSHFSPLHQDNIGQAIAGHMMVLGATGAGKTTLQSALAAFVQRFDPYMFVIDYKKSASLPLKVFGGTYFELTLGDYTYLQPFQLMDKPSNELKSFMYDYVSACVRAVGGKPEEFSEEIKEAVDSVFMLPVAQRRFSSLAGQIGHSPLLEHLKPWMNNGQYAWVTDSPVNKFNPLEFRKVGFDTTAIFKTSSPVAEPILSVLFFYKEMMETSGHPLLFICEEFWRPANYPTTQERLKDTLKSGRMRFEFLWLVSQSPKDAVNCAIFDELVEQTPTKILLALNSSNYANFEKVGVTRKEFKKLELITLEERRFLIKQNNSSCFAKMDLTGFDDFIPVLSSDQRGMLIYKEIEQEQGTSDPEICVPLFIEEYKRRKAENRLPVISEEE